MRTALEILLAIDLSIYETFHELYIKNIDRSFIPDDEDCHSLQAIRKLKLSPILKYWKSPPNKSRQGV